MINVFGNLFVLLKWTLVYMPVFELGSFVSFRFVSFCFHRFLHGANVIEVNQ